MSNDRVAQRLARLTKTERLIVERLRAGWKVYASLTDHNDDPDRVFWWTTARFLRPHADGGVEKYRGNGIGAGPLDRLWHDGVIEDVPNPGLDRCFRLTEAAEETLAAAPATAKTPVTPAQRLALLHLAGVTYASPSELGYAIAAHHREADGRLPMKPQGAGRIGGVMGKRLVERGLASAYCHRSHPTWQVGFAITPAGRRAINQEPGTP